MPHWTDAGIVAEIVAAERERREITRFTVDRPELDVGTAYRLQAAVLAARDGGERVGVKLGLTSEAKQHQMGVAAPLTGMLTADMRLEPGETIPFSDLIHPKVEPEIALVLGSDLTGPHVTVQDAAAAVAHVHAGIEVIDSRYRDFDFRLPDVIADNSSSARFVVLPDGFDPVDVDLVGETVQFFIDDELVGSASGAAVLGDPLRALAFAANEMAAYGEHLRAGEIVLTGALTDAHRVRPHSDVVARFSTLGTLTIPGADIDPEGARS